jgi:hypothetical protein
MRPLPPHFRQGAGLDPAAGLRLLHRRKRRPLSGLALELDGPGLFVHLRTVRSSRPGSPMTAAAAVRWPVTLRRGVALGVVPGGEIEKSPTGERIGLPGQVAHAQRLLPVSDPEGVPGVRQADEGCARRPDGTGALRLHQMRTQAAARSAVRKWTDGPLRPPAK